MDQCRLNLYKDYTVLLLVRAKLLILIWLLLSLQWKRAKMVYLSLKHSYLQRYVNWELYAVSDCYSFYVQCHSVYN